jgi:uncharacterized protein (DUF2249 family)
MLADGREPFSTIMATVDDLAADEALVLRSPFDPVPLHHALGARGFSHETRELGPDDFETVYSRDEDAGPAPEEQPAARPAAAVEPATHIVVDVRGMTPPQPLDLTLAALETLERGQRLLQINERVPVFLLPLLDERGFAYAIGEDERGTLIHIWHGEDDAT